MLRGISQGNVVLDVFQKTKVPRGVFVRESSGYQVAATEAPILHCGRLAVLYPKAEHLSLEALCLHGPNVVSFQMVTGQHQWHVVGCYIAPNYVSTIEKIVASIRRRP